MSAATLQGNDPAGAPREDHPTLIAVEDLTIGYDGKVIQQQLSFNVERGEIFAILGGSGSGKSSLLKNLIGLSRPMSGRILIGGEDITTAEGEQRQQILQKFGVTYQGGALFGSLSVLENVSLPLEEFTDLPPPTRRWIALAKLNQVGLLAAANKMPAELSGGMLKRAAIARAMALDPGLLFLDEPSAGLDPVTSAELDQTVLRLSRGFGITFVIVTHELPSIYAIADRCIMLDAATKTIVARGVPAQLRDHAVDPAVQRFFRREPA